MGFKSRPFPVDQRRIVDVVLAGDPSVVLANQGNPALLNYRYTEPDMSAIVVPDDATIVRFRPLQKHERENAETLAGPIPNKGAQVYSEAHAKAKEASDLAGRRATLKGMAADPRADNAFIAYDDALARAIDAASEADQKQVHRFRAWNARRNAEIVRRAVVAVVLSVDETGEEDKIEADPVKGFPVEDFAATVDIVIAQERHARIEERSAATVQATAALREALEGFTPEERYAINEASEAGRRDDVPEPVQLALDAVAEAKRIGPVGATSAADLIEEMAHHIEVVSSLGKGGRTYCNTPSGGGTGTTPRPASTAGSA